MSKTFTPVKKHPGVYSYLENNKKKYKVRITYNHRGKRKEHAKQGFSKIAAANAYIQDVLPKLKAGNINSVINSNRTLEEHWESYRDWKVMNRKWNKATLNTNTIRIQHFLDKFETIPLDDLTRSDIQNHINELYEENPNYSQETIKSFVKVFWQVIDDAVEEDYLEKNRFKKISWEKPGGNWKPKKKVLEYEDYKQFMMLAKEHMREDVYRCFYMVTFGLRRSEAYGIRQSSIHFLDNGLTRIDINWARTRDYPEGKYVKSKDSDRFIIVDEKATKMLHDQISLARKIKAKFNQTLHKEDYIFLAQKTGNPYYIKMLNDHMNDIAAMIDKDLNVFPHMFRHMFATNASASGVDSLQLRKYLGHADIEMTDHYTHGSIEGAEKVMRMTEKYRK